MRTKKQENRFLINRIMFFTILSILVILFWVILTFSFYSIVKMDNSLTDISNFERDYLEATFRTQEIISGNTIINSYRESRILFENCSRIINKLKNDRWFNKFASASAEFPEAFTGIFQTWELLQRDQLTQFNEKMEEVILDEFLISRSRMTNLQEWFHGIIRKGEFSHNAFELISRVERMLEFKPRFFSQFSIVRNAIITNINHKLTETIVIALVFSFLIFILAIIIVVFQFRQRNMFTRQLEHLVLVRTNELKITQIKLIETERMAALGKLTRGLAHEFNTPLGNIKVAINLLEEEQSRFMDNPEANTNYEDKKTAYRQKMNEIIKHINGNNERNINILKELQSIQPGEFSDQLQDININEFFSRIKQYVDLEDFSGIWKLNLNIRGNLTISTYAVSLLMVFQKLIHNTLIHSGNPEEKCEVTITAAQTGDKVMIVYSDYGQGIQEDLAENMFEPFTKIQGASTHHGLGLFSVNFILVNRLSGTITYDKFYKKGVKYIISLPASINE